MAMSTNSTPLPGRDKSIDYISEPDRAFRSLLIDFDNAELPITTLREITMLRFMDDITDKPEWNIHINDPEVSAKWREEAVSSSDDFTPNMMEWCIAELRYKASLIPHDAADKQPPIFVFNGDVVKSDTALSVELKQALQEAVIKFEHGIPANLKDYRPDSDGKVWDVVHPSLFPLIYGRTRVLEMGTTAINLNDCLERSGEGNIVNYPGKSKVKRQLYADELPFSEKFQWLPCEVDISGDEPRYVLPFFFNLRYVYEKQYVHLNLFRINSYINNLHPSEKPLYDLLEKVIGASIPLWDLTLAPTRRRPYDFAFRIPYDIDTNSHVREDSEGESGSEVDEAEDGGEHSSQADIRPEPKLPFAPLASPTQLSLKEEYGHLQVIVQLTNIELTPEKPAHEDNFWNIQTPLNEHIVASSLYVYSCSNVKPFAIGFRQIFPKSDSELDRDYRPNDPRWLTTIFGVEEDTQAVQVLGAVSTPEGRVLTFPNILQYSMEPVELEDPSKPGHLKFVVLYLVDPNIRIISTAHVPCQRRNWLEEVDIQQSEPVPSDFPISLQDAKLLREELMNEREDFASEFESKIEVIGNNFY
ncbi:hypothetical protein CVT25_010587 [Psilocybe cyanescens]|uniref:Uncharacterized protein n=1 Tax=Psilocybe cyanescens TaxID=93625 RepID=A0A409WJB8_PSICY|nr:hypothetical protein CVT25_010587 [Psilocybe cyanescens]